jgi:hypothetical protein
MSQDKTPKTFFRHKRVIAVVIITLLLVAYITNQIIVTDNLKLVEKLGKEDAELFMESFKLPIGILAAGLSLLLLLATQHRSEQTAEQIKLTNKANKLLLVQNTLKNYYDSIADFEKYVDNNFHSDVIEIKNKRQLYQLFFPNNSYENVDPYTTKDIYIQRVNVFLNDFNQNVQHVLSSVDNETPKLKFQLLINMFILNIKSRYSIHLTDNAFREDTQADDELAKITKEVRELLTFCLNYTPSNGIVVMEGSYIFSLISWANFRKYINENHTEAIKDFKVIKNKHVRFDGEIKLTDNKERVYTQSYQR